MSLESRFWSKVRKLGPGVCWPWLAATLLRHYHDLVSRGERGDDGRADS